MGAIGTLTIINSNSTKKRVNRLPTQYLGPVILTRNINYVHVYRQDNGPIYGNPPNYSNLEEIPLFNVCVPLLPHNDEAVYCCR